MHICCSKVIKCLVLSGENFETDLNFWTKHLRSRRVFRIEIKDLGTCSFIWYRLRAKEETFSVFKSSLCLMPRLHM